MDEDGARITLRLPGAARAALVAAAKADNRSLNREIVTALDEWLAIRALDFYPAWSAARRLAAGQAPE